MMPLNQPFVTWENESRRFRDSTLVCGKLLGLRRWALLWSLRRVGELAAGR
jgi:hypothetical protein